MWKEDVVGHAKVSMGVLNPIPFCSIWGIDELRVSEKENFINSEISKYIEFWNLGMSKDNSYFRVMGPCVKYWENILELLSRHIPWQNFVLLEGFRPSSNWKTNYECASICMVVYVDLKDHVIPPYSGPRSMHPSLNTIVYMHFHDLFVSNFVLVWPIVYLIWMGRVKSEVVKDQRMRIIRRSMFNGGFL